MGNGYFGTSQARKDKRKTKDFTYNYVDRIRLAEGSLQDQNYPVRGSGWRHKSVSHLDLAISCHGAASGPNHWSTQRQLRPSRSLDYSHIDRCKDALDIAEYHCRIDPEEHYDSRQGGHKAGLDPSHYQHRDVALFRECAGESYRSTNSIYSPQQQQQEQQQHHRQLLESQIRPFDVGNDSCSLRRSRSLAVIREETFSDLQIPSSNSGCRRSQLIPRARLVNRGFFREHEARFNCVNNKHHPHHSSREKLTNDTEQDPPNSGSGAAICDPHQHPAQHHHPHHHNHQTHHKHHHQLREAEDYYDNLKRLDAAGAGVEHLHPWHNDKSDLESLNSDYFKNSLHQSHELKQQKQFHQQQQQLQQQQQQQHQQQQQQQQQQQLHLEKEPADNTTTLSRSDKTRIYQSKRQQRLLAEKHTSQIQQQASKLQAPNSADSCPETSQSSVFPGTTTSNSDDQTDSLSCSEQEYDLARIEALYHQTKLEQDDEESYELISLTTTTRTRIETSEDEDDEGNSKPQEEHPRPHSTETTSPDNEIPGTLKRTRSLGENFEKLIAYDSVYLSSEESSGSTIIEGHTEVSQSLDTILSNEQVTRTKTKTKTTLLHISIEDTVFDSPLHSCGEHQSEDDVVNEEDVRKEVTRTARGENSNIEIPKQSDNKENVVDIAVPVEPPLYSQILNLDHSADASLFATTTSTVTSIPAASTSSAATKPRILAVVEKRKLKRAADCLNSVSNDHQQTVSGCGTRNGVLKNKFKANLIQNQYHSLPDVNIGKSLKVSERIDAKLRSSYNVNNYQPAGDDVSNCRPRKSKVSVVPLNQTASAEVTTAEINDSIKKFGQEHQKARLQEYEDLYEETIIREEIGVREKKKPCLEKTEINAATYTKEIKAIEEERKRTTNKPANSSTVEIHELCLESTSEINVAKTVSTAGTEVLDYLAEHSSESELKTDTNEYEEQPKEAPSIEVPHFTREIERRAKEIKQIAAGNKANKKQQTREEEFQSQTFTSSTFRISKSTKNYPQPVLCGNASEATANPFRIIVTDAQNNVIEEDSIEEQHSESVSSWTTLELAQIGTTTASDKVEQIHRIQTKDVAQNRGKSSIPSHRKTATSSLKRIPSKPKRAHISGQQYHYHSNQDAEFANQKSKERRVLSTQIYKARPVKVLTANDSFRRAAISTKMSRPQILHIVDNKRDANVGPATGRAAGSAIINSLTQIGGNEVENEYMKKVDAVRCYWSKLAQNEQEQEEEEEQQREREAKPEKKKEQQQGELRARQHVELLATGNSGTHGKHHQAKHLGAQQETRANNPSELETKKPAELSFMPSIEIVELDGEKTAAIVSAVSPSSTADSLSNEAKEPQFDHIRYKVMKSQQLLRTNMLARHKKEAQFDGLIQYLQDYSFQELLSNNNVVIVEPVRTKIERPSQTVLKPNANGTNLGQSKVTLPSKAEETNQLPAKLAREETNDTSKNVPGSESKQSSGIKRHFFYQPVRVNRELYEEELPHPDTVRNVRKFFEENVLPTPGRGIAVQRCRLPNSNSTTHREGVQEYPQLSPRSSRVRKYRYLTIDTSYGHSGEGIQSPQAHGTRKWDSASLSSGISSGDLSSPCECIEVDASVPGQLTTETSGVEQQHYLPRANELKGVHVKDVVRRHNTTNEGERHTREVNADGAVNGKSRRLRSQSILRENIYYRNIDEYNASQCYGAMESNCRQSRHCGQYGNDMFVDEDEEDVDDEDDELSESYYVSNDILEKIREYGSSVTYYGGRVLQKTSPDPISHSSHGNCNNGGPGVATLNPSPSTMTLTRVRAKELETCGDCQSNKCPQDEHLKDKFKDRTTIEQRKNEDSSVTRSSNHDAYWGVKFKLIKSNSCSSRLELAGTEEDVQLAEAPTEDTDVVRDIVKRLEATKDTKQKDNRVSKSSKQANRNTKRGSSGDSALTINNQMTSDATLLPQVTVNNHINVAIPAAPLPHLNTMKILKALTAEEPCSSVVGDGKETDVQRETTFESTALNIRLDVGGEKYHKDTNCDEKNGLNRKSNNHNNTANGTTKICRNKNVDLAFMMTRQQQTHRSSGPTKEGRKSSSFQPTLQSTLEHTHVEKVTKHPKNASETKHELINTSGPNKCAIKTLPADRPMKSSTSTTGDTTRANVADPKKSINIPDRSLDTNRRNDSPKPINKSTTKITVPVEIHQRTVQYTEPTRITVGEDKSSTQTSIGKTFVRHYVANDKSLLERRKYDDIEFEEFEVYDPSKDVDRLKSSGGDGNKPQRTSSVSDLSSLNDDAK